MQGQGFVLVFWIRGPTSLGVKQAWEEQFYWSIRGGRAVSKLGSQ